VFLNSSGDSYFNGGNLLVGQTSGDSADTGHIFNPLGVAFHTRDSGVPLVVRRNTDNGELLQFKKDTAVVGSIGTISSLMTIGTGTTGLIFDSAQIYPWNMTTNSATDASKDLGATGARFKDLYLSGGVVFGPASASNVSSQTLSSYEEGTWTPAVVAGNGTQPSISYTHNTGSYTKVGRLVTLIGYIEINAISGIITGNLNITGLPFVQRTGNGYAANGSSSCHAVTFARPDRGDISHYNTNALGFLTQTNGSDWGWERVNILSAGAIIRFSVSYYIN